MVDLCFREPGRQEIGSLTSGLLGRALRQLPSTIGFVKRWFLSGLLAVVLASCGCDAEGCGNDLRFDAATLRQWIGSGAFVIEVCADDRCESLNVPANSTTRWFGFPLDEDVSEEVAVEVTITAGSDEKHASGIVELNSYQPNGRFCTPTCSGADLTVNGDSVRNAEPGLIAPRD